MLLDGIDVSEWQGPDIDWGLVATAQQFAIVRGGDGRHRDPYLQMNVQEARAAGLLVNTYHYLRFALTPQEMANECRQTAEAAPGMRLWLDLEDTSLTGMMMPAQRVDWLQDVIARLTMPLGIYTAAWWWVPNMADSAAFSHLPVWLAGYPYGNNPPGSIEGLGPTLCGGWQKWDIWQFTSSGQVPGIAGRVDLNLAQPGTLEEDDMSLDDTMMDMNGQPLRVKVLNAAMQIEEREVTFREYVTLEALGLVIKACRCEPLEAPAHIHQLQGTAE